MSKRNRALIILLAAAVLLVMLSSVFFIAIEAGHDCIGDDCPICYQIGVCENALKSVGQAILVVILAAFIGTTMFSMPSFAKKPVYNTSLVTLKVKLSD